MKITFDPAKRDHTLQERGLDFADAPLVFGGPTLTIRDKRFDYGEERFQTVGYLFGRMVMIVWTGRSSGRHIISMRKCNAREREAYGQRFEEG
jgi:uncharacterized DUF497 family protein